MFNRPEVAEGAARLLQVLAGAIAFNSTLFTSNAILQSFGRTTRPVVDMAIGGVVKIGVSYFLTGIPEINVMGSAISTVVSYFIIMVLNLAAIRGSLPRMDSTAATAAPILASAVVMGGVYTGLCSVLPERVAVLPAILTAVVVYAVCVVLFRGVSYDDVAMLPKGEAIARKLRVKRKVRARHMAEKTVSTRPGKGGRHMRNLCGKSKEPRGLTPLGSCSLVMYV